MSKIGKAGSLMTTGVLTLALLGSAPTASAAGLPSQSGAGAESTDDIDHRDRATRPGPGSFYANGDKVHYSSSDNSVLSGHGWWVKLSGAGTKARVTVWLQQRKGGWKPVAKDVKTVKPGGGRGKRATAREKCGSRKTTAWRSVIDVDIIGVNDSPEKAYTKTVRKKCRA